MRPQVERLRSISSPFSADAGRGLFSQGVRYAISGVIVATVYFTVTTVLSLVAKMPFQVALAIGFCLSIFVHFTLQRFFVWTDQRGYALSFRYQVGRYLIAAGAQYAVAATTTSLLPSLLGVSTEAVYIVSALFTASVNFLVFRKRVFHANAVVTEVGPLSAVVEDD
jgi:putative flippase GtrA